MDFLVRFLATLIQVLQFAILGRVILSWVDPTGQYKVSQVLQEITEPVIGPIRKVLPRMGMLDLSPLIALLLLNVLQVVFRSAS
ncbi:MAG: YggT family protein [Herpetosiphonaceae bacterium]|nr:YggT family protein [Herpetosiphonaceae bacterium]